MGAHDHMTWMFSVVESGVAHTHKQTLYVVSTQVGAYTHTSSGLAHSRVAVGRRLITHTCQEHLCLGVDGVQHEHQVYNDR